MVCTTRSAHVFLYPAVKLIWPSCTHCEQHARVTKELRPPHKMLFDKWIPHMPSRCLNQAVTSLAKITSLVLSKITRKTHTHTAQLPQESEERVGGSCSVKNALSSELCLPQSFILQLNLPTNKNTSVGACWCWVWPQECTHRLVSPT